MTALVSSKAGAAGAREWFWLFAFMGLIAPTIFNYTPYRLMWDESYYAHRIICMNHAIYGSTGDTVASCLGGAHKGPVMQLLSLPWGPAGGTEWGIGFAFVSLALLLWTLAWLTYSVYVRAGAPEWALALAAAGICATPFMRQSAGALMTDMLVGWSTALALAFIPLEYRTRHKTAWPSFARGLLWGLAVAIGALAKVTFVFFFGLIGLALVWLRWRRSGPRPLGWALLGAVVAALPAIVVWAVFGGTFIEFAVKGAFGEYGDPFRIPGMTFLGFTRAYFAGLRYALVPLAVLLVLFGRGVIAVRPGRLWCLAPLAVVFLYLVMAARTGMLEQRYLIPVMISLPLALAWLPNAERGERRAGAIPSMAAILAGAFLAMPMAARPLTVPARHALELMETLTQGRPVEVLIATDGPDYNVEVFQLARYIAGNRLRPVIINTLVYDETNKRSLQEGLDHISRSAYILFLKPHLQPGPAWSRTREREYRAYTEKVGVLLNPAVSPDFDVFKIR